MSIELTTEQAEAIASQPDSVVVINPQTKQVYRLIREDVFQKLQALLYDASEWTPGEMAALAGAAFANLDDTDYSEYLDTP